MAMPNPRYGSAQQAFAQGLMKGVARNPRFQAALAVQSQKQNQQPTRPTVENAQVGVPMLYNDVTGQYGYYNTNPTGAKMPVAPPPAIVGPVPGDRRMDQVEAQRGTYRASLSPEAEYRAKVAREYAKRPTVETDEVGVPLVRVAATGEPIGYYNTNPNNVRIGDVNVAEVEPPANPPTGSEGVLGVQNLPSEVAGLAQEMYEDAQGVALGDPGTYQEAGSAIGETAQDVGGEVMDWADKPREYVATQAGGAMYRIATEEGNAEEKWQRGGNILIAAIGAITGLTGPITGLDSTTMFAWAMNPENKDDIEAAYNGYDVPVTDTDGDGILDTGDGKIDFTGERAVWELFVNGQGLLARVALDQTMDPFNWTPIPAAAGRRVATLSRGLREVPEGADAASGIVRAISRLGETAGQAAQAPYVVTDVIPEGIVRGVARGARGVGRTVGRVTDLDGNAIVGPSQVGALHQDLRRVSNAAYPLANRETVTDLDGNVVPGPGASPSGQPPTPPQPQPGSAGPAPAPGSGPSAGTARDDVIWTRPDQVPARRRGGSDVQTRNDILIGDQEAPSYVVRRVDGRYVLYGQNPDTGAIDSTKPLARYNNQQDAVGAATQRVVAEIAGVPPASVAPDRSMDVVETNRGRAYAPGSGRRAVTPPAQTVAPSPVEEVNPAVVNTGQVMEPAPAVVTPTARKPRAKPAGRGDVPRTQPVTGTLEERVNAIPTRDLSRELGNATAAGRREGADAIQARITRESDAAVREVIVAGQVPDATRISRETGLPWEDVNSAVSRNPGTRPRPTPQPTSPTATPGQPSSAPTAPDGSLWASDDGQFQIVRNPDPNAPANERFVLQRQMPAAYREDPDVPEWGPFALTGTVDEAIPLAVTPTPTTTRSETLFTPSTERDRLVIDRDRAIREDKQVTAAYYQRKIDELDAAEGPETRIARQTPEDVQPEQATTIPRDEAVPFDWRTAAPRIIREREATPTPLRPGLGDGRGNQMLRRVRDVPGAWERVAADVGDEAEELDALWSADRAWFERRRVARRAGREFTEPRPLDPVALGLAELRFRANLDDAVRRVAPDALEPPRPLRQSGSGQSYDAEIRDVERVAVSPWRETGGKGRARQRLHQNGTFNEAGLGGKTGTTKTVNLAALRANPDGARRYIEAVDLHGRFLPEDLSDPGFVDDVRDAALLRSALREIGEEVPETRFLDAQEIRRGIDPTDTIEDTVTVRARQAAEPVTTERVDEAMVQAEAPGSSTVRGLPDPERLRIRGGQLDAGEFPTLYRQSGLDEANDVIDGIARPSRHDHIQNATELYFSAKPETALGQGANANGITFTYDPSRFPTPPTGRNLQVQQQKPGWEFQYAQGDAEITMDYALMGRPSLSDAVDSFTVPVKIAGSRGSVGRLRNSVRQIEASGWTKTTNADGSVTYTRPDIATPQPTQVAPTPEVAPATGSLLDDIFTPHLRPTQEPTSAPVRNVTTDPEIDSLFDDLAQAQRGAPEQAMLDAQRAAGNGGVYPFTLEHVGDLTNRMGQRTLRADRGFGFVKDKVRKTLGTLKSGYGFRREMAENLRGNRVDADAVRAAGQAYADAHRLLPVYNDAQFHAREAAVAVGEQRFDDAVAHLEELQRHLGSEEEWVQYAGVVDPKYQNGAPTAPEPVAPDAGVAPAPGGPAITAPGLVEPEDSLGAKIMRALGAEDNLGFAHPAAKAADKINEMLEPITKPLSRPTVRKNRGYAAASDTITSYPVEGFIGPGAPRRIASDIEQEVFEDPRLTFKDGTTWWDFLRKGIDEKTLSGTETNEAVYLSLRELAEKAAKDRGITTNALPKWLRAYDSYLNAYREFTMYNIFRVADQPATQYVGNLATSLLTGNVKTTANMINPAELIGRYAKPGKKSRFIKPSAQRLTEGFGLGTHGRAEVSVSTFDPHELGSDSMAFERYLEKRVGKWPGRAIAFGPANRYVRDLAFASDRFTRETMWSTRFREKIPVALGDLRDEGRKLIKSKANLPPEVMDELYGQWRPLMRSGLHPDTVFVDFSNAMKRAGVNATTADEMARNMAKRWANATERVATEAGRDVERIFFSGIERNFDRALRRGAIFHYFASRQAVLYVTEALKNPRLIAAYERATDGFEKQVEDNNLPGYMKNFVKLFKSVGGFAIYANPVAMLMTMATFRDAADDDVGFLEQIADSFFLSPLIRGAVEYMGFTDPKFLSDPFAVKGMVKNAMALINWGRAQGHIPGEGPIFENKVEVGEQWLRSVISGWAEDLGIPGAEHMPAQQVGGTEKDKFNTRIWQLALEEGQAQGLEGPSLYDYANERATEAYDNPDDPLFDQAYRDWANAGGTEALINLSGPIQARDTLPIRDERAQAIDVIQGEEPPSPAITYPGTDIPVAPAANTGLRAQLTGENAPTEDQAALNDALYDARSSAQSSEAGRDLQRQIDGSETVGTENGREAVDTWNMIVYGPGEGETMEPVEIGGVTYTAEDLALIPQYENDPGGGTVNREQLANAWAQERNLDDDIKLQQAANDAYRAANPEYAEYREWQGEVYDYEGGVLKWWEDQAAGGNAAAGAYLAEQRERAKNDDQLEGYLTSPDAFLAQQGVEGSVYGQELPDATLVNLGSSKPAYPSKPEEDPAESIQRELDMYRAEVRHVSEILIANNISPGVFEYGSDEEQDYARRVLARYDLTVPTLSGDARGYVRWSAAQRENGEPYDIDTYLAWVEMTGAVNAAGTAPYYIDAATGGDPLQDFINGNLGPYALDFYNEGMQSIPGDSYGYGEFGLPSTGTRLSRPNFMPGIGFEQLGGRLGTRIRR